MIGSTRSYQNPEATARPPAAIRWRDSRIGKEMKQPNETRPRTSAQRAADATFKIALAPLTGDEQAKKDLDENRARLKALRLARDSELTKKA